jgi:hypothetical protein
MEAFDLVGGEVAGNARIIECRANPPAAAVQMLSDQLRDITRRANTLKRRPRELPLVNPSFEQIAPDGSAAGWVTAPRDKGMIVEVDRTQGSASPSSLHLANRGAGAPVWVRSSPLAPPTTGRVQMTARIRVADARQQPQLRLAVEGRLEGQVYYRRLNVGAAERAGDAPSQALTTKWDEYSIMRVDLPFAGLSELRVGFDLMSEGEVWIDDVRVQDLWLQTDEYDELIQRAATVRNQVRPGRLNECWLFVDGYWPSFLRRHVQLPEGREAVPPPVAAATGGLSPVVGELPEGGSAASDPAASLQRPARATERKSWLPSWWRWK